MNELLAEEQAGWKIALQTLKVMIGFNWYHLPNKVTTVFVYCAVQILVTIGYAAASANLPSLEPTYFLT